MPYEDRPYPLQIRSYNVRFYVITPKDTITILIVLFSSTRIYSYTIPLLTSIPSKLLYKIIKVLRPHVRISITVSKKPCLKEFRTSFKLNSLCLLTPYYLGYL